MTSPKPLNNPQGACIQNKNNNKDKQQRQLKLIKKHKKPFDSKTEPDKVRNSH